MYIPPPPLPNTHFSFSRKKNHLYFLKLFTRAKRQRTKWAKIIMYVFCNYNMKVSIFV